MNRRERGNAEASEVFGSDFRAGAFGGYHDYRDVLADLHAFFDDVEAVRVRQRRALLHQGHDRRNYVAVLFVGREVDYEVGGGNQFLVCADFEVVARSVFPRSPLFVDSRLAERVGDVEAAVAEVKPLVETLCAAAYDYDFLAFEGFDAAVEFRALHQLRLIELSELFSERQCIEIICHDVFLSFRVFDF